MALKDQNPAGLPFGLKVLWAIDWIQILRGQVYGLQQNGEGGGSTELVIGEPVTGGTPNRMLFIDGDGNVAVSDSYQAVNDFGNFIVQDGNFTVQSTGGSAITIDTSLQRIFYANADGGYLFLTFPFNTGSYTITYPLDSSGTVALQEWVNGQKGVANGIASLGSDGLVPFDQLPIGSALINKGAWNASTNTPTLVDGVGTNGDFYVVSVGATRDLGSGPIDFVAGNGVLYNGSIYQQIGAVMTATITSVSSANVARLSVVAGTGPNPTLDVVSAPKLQTPRNINNIAFDGTANILLNSTYNNQTGTTYTFVITDNQKVVTATNASAQTYTVPPNASVAFPIGTRIDVIQLGDGKVTIAQGSGVTINSYLGYKSIAGKYVGVTLLKTDTNTWVLVGNLIV